MSKHLKEQKQFIEEENVEIFGAREHNLKNININIPRNKLVVITGISGSGKSSLAFDTIYAEGQRRYMESFSAYARSFIGDMERPDVDKIEGLSPVISIEQKTTSRNPRSTVGTLTEVYDFMRLLFAKIGVAYSYLSNEKMIIQSQDQILRQIFKRFNGSRLSILSSVVKGRKGHYRELFQQFRKQGFSKVRVDGKLMDLVPKMQVDRYKIHDIELVLDRVIITEKDLFRISQSIQNALNHGKGIIMILDEKGNTQYFSQNLMDPTTGLAYDNPAPNNFSFNSPYGYCPICKGLGQIKEITKESIIPDDSLSISRGGIAPLSSYRDVWVFKKIEAVLKRNNVNITTPINQIPKEILEKILNGDKDKITINYEKWGDYDTEWEGVVTYLEKQADSNSDKIRKFVENFMIIKICPQCEGARLKKESLHFKINDKNIADLANFDIRVLYNWFDGLEEFLDEKQKVIATDVIKEIRKRLRFMLDVGLDYLSLNRPLRTLSGGETQRIRLATQIGTQLVGVLYILDEPSIGLHQRDNKRLIKSLQNLRDLGNSIIVVEHDKDMMLASDHIVDIGPGAGRHGGEVVAEGHPEYFLKQGSATADFLVGKRKIVVPSKRRKGKGNMLSLYGAEGNNLKFIDVNFPLGTMICLTGVSGSGKSSLIHSTLFPVLNSHFFNAKKKPLPFREIIGLQHIDKVIEVNQAPIGRTPRSNPATYTGTFTHIRNLFAGLPEARIRGYKSGRFSFNVKGGRCETCGGAGLKLIEMDFLPNVHVLCETCKGKRYNRETLEVRLRGKSIADVLDMTVEQAVIFFESYPTIFRKIKTIHEVGLDYITLGQHATTLSGGEAQRVKLAAELSKKDTGKTFYILDEPTTGLHFQDIDHLLSIVRKLVDKGNTVLIIEHNMDVVKVADWVIDLGPEGGKEGGKIVCEGSPEQVTQSKESYTGRFLKSEIG